jgi:transcriptional regulator with XRE-family HTH domain
VFKDLRQKNKITQQGLAKKLEVKQSTVAMWETGKSFPRFDMLPKLSKILNISIEELVFVFLNSRL